MITCLRYTSQHEISDYVTSTTASFVLTPLTRQVQHGKYRLRLQDPVHPILSYSCRVSLPHQPVLRLFDRAGHR